MAGLEVAIVVPERKLKNENSKMNMNFPEYNVRFKQNLLYSFLLYSGEEFVLELSETWWQNKDHINPGFIFSDPNALK